VLELDLMGSNLNVPLAPMTFSPVSRTLPWQGTARTLNRESRVRSAGKKLELPARQLLRDRRVTFCGRFGRAQRICNA
jgi:hypothetical protein